MKLQFDASQNYQLDAIRAVVDVFAGQPLADSDFQTVSGGAPSFADAAVANRLLISDAQIFENVKKIQAKFNDANRFADGKEQEKYFSYIEPSNRLIPVTTADGGELTRLNFTVEMETGTGKTYTYLRTIYELNKIYGFKKFVVVVPSVAIREGAMKNLAVTREHFQAIYGNPPVNAVLYDSAKPAALRNFARSNAIEILVINIDSFAKDANVINTVRETGAKPIEYIQATNPIVIVDEPQNTETDIRKTAVHNLNPLCTLRYSATNKNFYNLIYNLNPVQAYDLGLVKGIEVDGIAAADNYNAALVDFKGIERGRNTLKARIGLYVGDGSGVKQKVFSVGLGQDLHDLSGGRDVYGEGLILNNIDAAEGFVEFSGGLKMTVGEARGGLRDDIAKFQIERTVKRHFEKLARHKSKGVKILSLFFIDKVSNYREYDENGAPREGKFALWFEEIFNKYAAEPLYKGLLNFAAEAVHDGYFSRDKRGKIRDTRGNTEADRDTYGLIMKNKERLLDADEPLQFIFSHSALREGWDNPNVFQICTLNETASEMKKRQEIGRGLRLPVNHRGERIRDENVNVLTVVANESYESFSRALQNEIEDETSVKFAGRIKNARERREIKLFKELTPENCPSFFEIWDKIKQRTRYEVRFSSGEVVEKAVENLKDTSRFPAARKPRIESATARLHYKTGGVGAEIRNRDVAAVETHVFPIPDIFAYIQSRADVSRQTIYEIIAESGRAAELLINPQMFLDNVVAAVKQTLDELSAAGVRYEKINGAFYDLQMFEAPETAAYSSNLFEVARPDKTIFDNIEIGAATERDFARDCEADERVRFFFKLPRAFEIPTPLGAYTPDWAVIFGSDESDFCVVETKNALRNGRLSEPARLKIACAEKHFKALNVPFKSAKSVKDLLR